MQEALVLLKVKHIPGKHVLQISLSLGPNQIQRTIAFKIQAPELAKIEIFPKSIQLKRGEKLSFQAIGYTIEQQKIAFQPIWSASGGSISNDGVYVAGNVPGFHTVQVKDAKTNLMAKAQVEIIGPLNRIVIVPQGDVFLKPSEKCVFLAKGYTAQEQPITFNPQWNITGGTSTPTPGNSQEITYQAGQTLGRFSIQITDMETGISQETTVIIDLPGWFGETLPDGLVKGNRGEYIWQKDNSILVYIPSDDAIPQGFYMDKYELSVEQFERFVKSTKYRTSAEVNEYTIEWDGRRYKRASTSWRGIQEKYGPTYPVIYISWEDVQEYCR